MATSSSKYAHPPSAKFILHVLEEDGPSSISTLIEKTGMPSATVRGGVEKLTEAGHVKKVNDPEDARRVVCEIALPQ